MSSVSSISIAIVLLLGTPLASAGVDISNLLSPYKGRVVLIDFWASWCGPCLRSFPWMNEIAGDLESQGLTILAINVDRNRSEADDFLRNHPARFSVVYDPQGEYAKLLDVDVMPSSFLVNRDGQIVKRHRGFLSKDTERYRSLIEAELKKAPDGPAGTIVSEG